MDLTKINRTWLSALVAASAVEESLLAQGNEPLAIEQAVELRFKTSRGKTYTLQGSDDFNEWRNLGAAGYGDGKIKKHFLSVDDAEQNLRFFRLNVEEDQGDDVAAGDLIGKRFILNTGGFPQTIDFVSENQANRSSANAMDTVDYEYSKTGPGSGGLEIVSGDSRLRYSLEFTGREAGAFRLETFRGERIDDIDVGTFTVLSMPIAPPVPGEMPPLPSAEPGLAKSVISGLSFVFNDGGEPIWLQFQDEMNGRAIDDDDVEAFAYSIEPINEAEQVLRLDFGDEFQMELHLAYSGECSGTYILREIEDGNLDDVDMGTFSVSSEPIAADLEDDRDGHDGSGSSDDEDHGGSGSSDDEDQDGSGSSDDEDQDGSGSSDDEDQDGSGSSGDEDQDGSGSSVDEGLDGNDGSANEDQDGNESPANQDQDSNESSEGDGQDGSGSSDDEGHGGSGSSDDEDQDGSGSSDDEDQDGSGSSDDEDQDGSGSSDDEDQDGSGSSDDEDQDGSGSSDDDR